MRVAQFGGDNRPTDIDTILKMIAGIDNTSANLSFEEQPGNQLAGFDISYYYNKNFKFYGQLIGEDEAGYLPSRNIKLVGSSWTNNNLSIPIFINFDYVDTFSGINNYAYNHSLYEDGFRYYKAPIGASIDADSSSSSITIKTTYNNTEFKINLSDINLNKNNSKKNFWSISNLDFVQTHFNIKKQYKNLYIDINYIYRNASGAGIARNNFFVSMSHKI